MDERELTRVDECCDSLVFDHPPYNSDVHSLVNLCNLFFKNKLQNFIRENNSFLNKLSSCQ
jgi:hypothetical protein